MKEYRAGIYLRLSKEDKKINNSIDVQRIITTNYAILHNYKIVKEYVDNGVSGILNSRPSFDLLINDIKSKKINMVIVKDISRLTRDRNLTGYIMDLFFPDNDVRFISVNEFIDSGDRYEIDDTISLRGIVNQSYLEDLSMKIKAVKTTLKKEGKFIENSVLYGYEKDKNNKYKIKIDNNVVNIVKRIFNEFIDGKKLLQIADGLNKEKIQTPSQYRKLKKQATYWSKAMVNRILNDPTYTGKMIINKYYSDFKLKKRVVTKKENFEFKENTHEAIISEEDFNKVQQLKMNKSFYSKNEYIFLLKDLVYCNNCGRRMLYKNSSPVRMDRRGKITGKKNDFGYYICAVHYRHSDVCNQKNKIMENDLNQIVINKIKSRISQLGIEIDPEKVKEYIDKKDINYNEEKKINKELELLEKDFKIMYAKKVEGIITQYEFLEKYDIYKQQTATLKEKISQKQKIKKDVPKVNKKLKQVIDEFLNAKKFDNKMIKNFVERIEIGENKKVIIKLKV